MSGTKSIRELYYRLGLLGVSILFIISAYYGCGASTQEVAKTEKKDIVSQTKQDSIRKRQVDIDFNTAYFEYYSHKRYKEAIPFYRKAINNDKEVRYPGMFQQLGQCYIEMEEPDSAQLVYETGVKLKPDDRYMHEKLQWIYESKRDIDKAIEEANIIIELGGDEDVYLMKLKDLYVRNNQIDEAIETYDKLIEKDPDNKEFHDQKTNLIKLSGGSVIDEYKKLHEQYPEDKKYIEALLVEYSRNNDDADVLIMADKLLALEPENVLALDKKADSYANLQKWRERIDVLNRKIEIMGNNAEILTGIAESYNYLKNYRTARTYANRALKVNSNYGMAYIRIGEAYEYCAEDVVSKKGGFSKMTFDDKLVYEVAYNQYRRASKYPDSAGIAARKMNAVRQMMPTKEDKFMNPDKKRATNPAYRWIY